MDDIGIKTKVNKHNNSDGLMVRYRLDLGIDKYFDVFRFRMNLQTTTNKNINTLDGFAG